MHCNFNIHGKMVERPKDQYPYSYDPFKVYKSPFFECGDSADYSDRLRQWDHKKYKESCMTVWGFSRDYFYGVYNGEVERFLQLYYDNDGIRLTGIEEGCNFASGYPYWIFYYRKDKWKKGELIHVRGNNIKARLAELGDKGYHATALDEHYIRITGVPEVEE